MEDSDIRPLFCNLIVLESRMRATSSETHNLLFIGSKEEDAIVVDDSKSEECRKGDVSLPIKADDDNDDDTGATM